MYHKRKIIILKQQQIERSDDINNKYVGELDIKRRKKN